MDSLSNALLIDTYKLAVHFQLEKQFIQLLELEIKRRNIQDLLLERSNM